MEQSARNVVGDLSMEAEGVKVTDYNANMAYSLLSTPGLVINEKVVSARHIPSTAKVTTWLTRALEVVEDQRRNV